MKKVNMGYYKFGIVIVFAVGIFAHCMRSSAEDQYVQSTPSSITTVDSVNAQEDTEEEEKKKRWTDTTLKKEDFLKLTQFLEDSGTTMLIPRVYLDTVSKKYKLERVECGKEWSYVDRNDLDHSVTQIKVGTDSVTASATGFVAVVHYSVIMNDSLGKKQTFFFEITPNAIIPWYEEYLTHKIPVYIPALQACKVFISMIINNNGRV